MKKTSEQIKYHLNAIHNLLRRRTVENSSYHLIKEHVTDDVIVYLLCRKEISSTLQKLSAIPVPPGEVSFTGMIYSVMRRKLSCRKRMSIYMRYLKHDHDFCTFFDPSSAKANDETYSRLNREIQLPNVLVKAIKDDSVPAFVMHLDMCGKRLSPSLLHFLCHHGAGKILGYLLKENKIPRKMISGLQKTIASICSYAPEKQILQLLGGIEDSFPGYVKNYTDDFGRNLLWKIIPNTWILWEQHKSPVIQFLLDAGCDPENKFALGVSWKYFHLNVPRDDLKELLCGTPFDTEKKMDWSQFRLTDQELAPQVIKKITRTTAFGSLKDTYKERLADRLREVFWNFAFMPEKTLPPLWQQQIVCTGEKEISLPEDAEGIIREAMASFHHPESGSPLTARSCELLATPEIPWETVPKDRNDHLTEILSSGLSVYNPLIRRHLLKTNPRVCSTFRYLDMKPADKIADPILRQAVEEDDVRTFAQWHEKAGIEEFAPETVDAVLRGGKRQILIYLLDNTVLFTTLYPPEELIFYGASQLDDQTGIILFEELNERWPEKLSACDCSESNALFYTLFNKNIRCYEKDCALVNSLKKHCPKDHRNIFGFNFNDVIGILTDRDRALRSAYLDKGVF